MIATSAPNRLPHIHVNRNWLKYLMQSQIKTHWVGSFSLTYRFSTDEKQNEEYMHYYKDNSVLGRHIREQFDAD